MPSAKSRTHKPAPRAPIARPDLPPDAQAIARQLAQVIEQRASDLITGGSNEAAPYNRGKYTGDGSQVVESRATEGQAPDVDAVAIALRERLVRHSLDAMAAHLLPKSIAALDSMLAGEHPDSRGAAQAAKLVFDALRMTGTHVLDRDRTIGSDALTVAELEQEIARASAALRRKLAPSVVSTVPASSSPADL